MLSSFTSSFSPPLPSKLEGYLTRRQELLQHVRGSKYEVQKSHLSDDFCAFLAAHSSLPPPSRTSPSVDSATPDDIGKFLYFRDSCGRTQIHVNGCTFFGKSGTHDCGCRVGLAAGTIDSMIGKLGLLLSVGVKSMHTPLPTASPIPATPHL